MLRACISLILFCFIFSAAAAEPAAGYKGFKLGMQEKEIEQKDGFKCRYFIGGAEGDICVDLNAGSKTIAGQQVTTLACMFYNNILQQIFIAFSSDDIAPILSAITSKYGAPIETTVPMKTPLGMEVTNEIYQWKRQKDKIMLTKYGKEITHGVLTMQTNEYDKLHADREKKIEAENNKDL